ncbi:hypothetical protein B0J17DRAFT_660675 [Rhizoctonia solani]|nr:hypothetical protein B0J17DRAFT_660675 [Rhizoctonia solani]
MDDPAPVDHNPSVPKRHSKFYLKILWVHKHQLLKSEKFSDMFKADKVEDDEPEKLSSPDHPITMEGVAAADFEALLTVLYACYYSTRPDQPAPELDKSFVIPAFRLAHLWNFTDLRAYLLPLAEKALSDVQKIVFAREYSIQTWIVPTLVKLCQRFEPLTSEEARKLGLDTVLIISHMREKFRPVRPTSHHGDPESYYCQNCAGFNMQNSERVCYACNRRSNGAHYYHVSGRDGVTTEALTTRISGWIANGCTIATT